MADIKKVTKGLEHCLSRYVDGLCDDCPYMGAIDKTYMIPMKCKEIIMRDALELLKEQNGLAKALEQMTATNDYLNKEVERLETEQPKWIPLSERLPKKEDIPYDCLVTLEHGVVCEATFLDMDAPYHKWCANTGWLYHVTHWMPLPKPPKKDGEQE